MICLQNTAFENSLVTDQNQMQKYEEQVEDLERCIYQIQNFVFAEFQGLQVNYEKFGCLRQLRGLENICVREREVADFDQRSKLQLSSLKICM